MKLSHLSTEDLTQLLEQKVGGLKVQSADIRGGQRRVFVGSIGKKMYALKVFEGYSDALVRAQRELGTLKKCASAHVVKPGPFELIQLTETEEAVSGEDEPAALWLYVEEFVEGESLRQRLLRGPLTVSEAFQLALECLDGIEALWWKKRVHRDLKPANIMIRSSDRAFLIIDVGYVLVLDSSRVTSPHLAVGTPGYMPPEQFSGRSPRVDFRADVFGLGACVYEALTGQQPFRRPGDNKEDVLKRTLKETPQPPATVRLDTPLCFSEIVLRMLAKKTHLRPRNIPGLRKELEQCRDEGAQK
jgi:eukaryotic-like serine/threonine-protein kinase